MPLCALSTGAGALSGSLIASSQHAYILTSIIAVLFLGACVIALRRRDCFPENIFRATALSLVFFSAGIFPAFFKLRSASDFSVPRDRGARILCEGRVSGSLRQRAWGVQADVKLLRCAGRSGGLEPARGLARLSVGGEGGRGLLPGDVIRFRASFGKVREMKNPGSFSYGDYLATHGIGAVANSYGVIEKVGSAEGAFARLERIRRGIAASISSSALPQARDILVALATGDRSGIDPEVREAFSSAGIAHLMAISGLHVGFVAAFLYLFFRLLVGRISWLLLRVPLPRLAAIFTIPAIWLYVLITGSSMSAVRAGLMLTLVLIGVLSGRRQDAASTLSAAAVVILLMSPLAVQDVSFQLSIAAVAGMVIIVPRLMPAERRNFGSSSAFRRFVRGVWVAFAASAAATAATAPLIAWHFKFVTGIALFANVLAVPAFGALLAPIVAVASVVSILSHSAAAPIWNIAGVSALIFVESARRLSELFSPLVFHFAPSPFELVLIYAALLAVVFYRKLPYRGIVAAVLASLFVMDAGYWRLLPSLRKDIQITIIDAGQGDSALVRFPGGKAVLIDGGGIKGSSFDVGKHVVAPALWRMGVHSVDWMILTHPHYDHYRGLGYLASQFSPSAVYGNGLGASAGEASDWDIFMGQLKDAGVPMLDVGKHRPPEEVGGVKVRVTKPPVPAGSDLNDTSLVVRFDYGSRRFLFTGDLAISGEAALLNAGEDLRADFLKVGHHGSADASSARFLKAVSPRIAAISAGEQNRYGLPARDALARLEAVGARIYRTDMHGAITVTSDGEDLNVETFVRR
ncbi:MAG TPA: DNA internalization-related competence protein ComEC/Rec2 [bacterium]|nr:DNA internalization-related competence protein ComEC/Rec2 [bacterium]